MHMYCLIGCFKLVARPGSSHCWTGIVISCISVIVPTALQYLSASLHVRDMNWTQVNGLQGPTWKKSRLWRSG